jgi:four helix bundle protein
MIKSYKDLDVWKKSIELVKRIYSVTQDFPKEETFCLTNQIRRSAISISSNIAEGKSRQHVNEYIQFLYIGLGSCAELESQITIAKQLVYLNSVAEKEIMGELDYIGRMFTNLIKSLRKSTAYNLLPKTKNLVPST